MTVGAVNGLNNVNYYNYNRINQIKPVENTDDGLVRRVGNETDRRDTIENVSERDTSRLLPEEQVIDFAINKDLNSDRSLIGTDMKLENLDVQKALSDMQKDSIIREYQYFVQDPLKDGTDGIVIKKG